jgi:hypothetical protein
MILTPSDYSDGTLHNDVSGARLCVTVSRKDDCFMSSARIAGGRFIAVSGKDTEKRSNRRRGYEST